MKEIFVHQHRYASYITKRIGHIHNKPHCTYIFEGSNQAIEKNAVERNITKVQTHPNKGHPYQRADYFSLKQEICNTHQNHSGCNN
ncbi:MAG: hypothetical protein IT213_03160 [Cytophagales bacterium]|nr:hypothetical protein [Cytophagales bacterium]